jgi:DNA-nicking Smr family endonuclease
MATREKNARELALEEERKLYEREMAGVRPLRSGGPEVVFERNPPSSSRPTAGADPRVIKPTVNIEKNGRVWGRGAGVSETTMRSLAKGEFPVAATCDLHGYRDETARRRVKSFLTESQQRGRHVVLVICGRGLHSGPLPSVLRQATLDVVGKAMGDGLVLAAVSAPPAHGGEGAVLVMLQRKQLF